MKIIIFDGICNLCEFSVQFIIRNDKCNVFKFLPLQSPKLIEYMGQNDIKNQHDSVIYYRDSNIFYRSDAVLWILKDIGSYWSYFFYLKFIPGFIRDKIYDFIAKHRYNWFGKKDSCLIPDEQIKNKFLDWINEN